MFDKDLLIAEKIGFSCNKPSEVYFSGRKMNLSKSITREEIK